MLRCPSAPHPRWRALAGAALAVAALSAACGPGPRPPGSDTEVDVPGEPVEVTFWHSMAGSLRDPLQELVDRFNLTSTDGKIVLAYQGDYGTLKQKTQMAIQSGHPPDLAQVYEAWTTFFNSDKANPTLLPLDDFVRQDRFDLSDFYKPLIDDNTYDGQLLSFPFNKSLPVLFYNKSLFGEAGLDPNRPPRTWAQFAEFGRRLTRDRNGDGRPDVYAWAFPVDPWVMLCLVLQEGGALAANDRDLMPLDSAPMVKALSFWSDAVLGPSPWAVRRPGREFQNDFIAQRVGMIVTTGVSRTFMIDQIQFPLGIAPIPTLDGRRGVIMAGTNVALFAAASPRRRRVAWEFVKFFTSTEGTALWAMRTGYVPVRRSAVASPAFQDYLRKDPSPLASIEQLEHATFEPRIQEWYEIRDKLGRAIERTLQRQGTVEENLQAAQADLLKALAQRKVNGE